MDDYKVLERSYINGTLREPGEVVTLEIDNPGSNLELVTSGAKPLDKQTIKELQATADSLGLTIPDGASKADIVALIKDNDTSV
ncbi:hypothetical protein [Pseudomonas sp. RIT-To-2]|uniref:hypothetical protein n=1 Tax=Pseudomonas sp. RIT-To-2 TaxID=3462541 RepID=UPI0024132698